MSRWLVLLIVVGLLSVMATTLLAVGVISTGVACFVAGVDVTGLVVYDVVRLR
jgi:hypothetical protein